MTKEERELLILIADMVWLFYALEKQGRNRGTRSQFFSGKMPINGICPYLIRRFNWKFWTK
jgi:hypothetical protein